MDDWKLECTGTIERVERHDIDKSRDNPRIKIHLVVRPTEASAEAPDAELPELLTFGVMENELELMCDPQPVAGEEVRAEGRASGISPQHILLTSIARLEPLPEESDEGAGPKKKKKKKLLPG